MESTVSYQKRLAHCTVAIAGLGLMGGSLGLALRGRVARVVGIARRPESIRQAVAMEAIDEGYATLAEGAAQADILVLSTPISIILQQIEEIGRLAGQGGLRPGLVLTDMGSTKARIMQAMAALPAGVQPVGSHPMCGKELSGLDVAEARLYKRATWVLCQLDRTAPEALALVKSLALAVKARPVELEAVRHDRLVAAISHLPYVLSAALFAAAGELAGTDEMVWRVAASGFRSTTRLAGSDEQMMLDILLTNQTAVLEMIAGLRRQIDDLAALIAAGDDQALRHAMVRIRAMRGEFLEKYGA